MKKNWWRAILIGILVLICALPLIPVIVMILVVAGLLGRVSIFLLIGEKLRRTFNSKSPSLVLAVTLGAIVLNLVGSVPILVR